MQTFLPYPCFTRSARCLDRARLAKDPAHYRQFGWTEEPKLDYWWPTKELAA